jgi:hypothetical protein
VAEGPAGLHVDEPEAPRVESEGPAVLHVDEPEARPRVVAEVLSDGTVQLLDRAEEVESGSPWSSGVIAGSGWTIWWERRRWNDR